jgi:hypothetical protein
MRILLRQWQALLSATRKAGTFYCFSSARSILSSRFERRLLCVGTLSEGRPGGVISFVWFLLLSETK